MAADFDPEDRNSWYFGSLSREETNNILLGERDSGVFLVRDSASIRGDYVLCVKEDNKVSHYIINKIQVAGMTRFRIGDQEFPDIPSLLNFYKTHYLDTTSLIRSAPRERYIAKYDFPGKDPEDLPFRRGEVLTILTKDEEQWWTARNSRGNTGQVPVPYIQKYDPEAEWRLQDGRSLDRSMDRTSLDRTSLERSSLGRQSGQMQPNAVGMPDYTDPNNIIRPPASVRNGQRKLPAPARVVQKRVPNAYDKTALALEIGDVVLVTAMNINGEWEGKLNGKEGRFPFTHVEFIEEDEQQ